MPLKNIFSKIKLTIDNVVQKKSRQKDRVEIHLPGLSISFQRNTDIEVPHELTVVLPRTEIRKRCLDENCSKYEYELIYSSITIVDAPRHPLAGPSIKKSS